jgi:hypothetical protein
MWSRMFTALCGSLIHGCKAQLGEANGDLFDDMFKV